MRRTVGAPRKREWPYSWPWPTLYRPLMSISTDDFASLHAYDRGVEGVDAGTDDARGQNQDEDALPAYAAPGTHTSKFVRKNSGRKACAVIVS